MRRLFFILFLFSGLKALPCECTYEFSEFTPFDLIYYNRIIVCKPISVDTIGDNINYRAVVSKTYWGLKKDTVTITTARVHGMCGLPLDLNTRYLIYGKGDESIYINACGPSRKLLEDKDSFKEMGYGDADSVKTVLNGTYKYYTIPYLRDYFKKTEPLEIQYLEELSETFNGKIITKFTNGITSGEITVVNGKLNGAATFYFFNGKLKSKGNFTDNSQVGTWTECVFKTHRGKTFYLSRTGNYIDNKKTGQWKGKMLIGSFKEFKSYYGYNLDNDYK